jgi:V/A-type H+-transporting ATPase subunit E
MAILLPPEGISEDEVRKRIQAGDEDPLTEFVEGMLGEKVRGGISVELGDAEQAGLVVKVINRNVEIELTDQAITDLLAGHLLPRFRAVMRR